MRRCFDGGREGGDEVNLVSHVRQNCSKPKNCEDPGLVVVFVRLALQSIDVKVKSMMHKNLCRYIVIAQRIFRKLPANFVPTNSSPTLCLKTSFCMERGLARATTIGGTDQTWGEVLIKTQQAISILYGIFV